MIDLSKAYAGQTVMYRNKQNAVINTIYLSDFTEYYSIHSVCGNFHTLHRKDGTDLDNEAQFDIIALFDPIQVQVARLEGELKGINFAILTTNNAADARVLFKRLNEVQTQLLTLQNNQ